MKNIDPLLCFFTLKLLFLSKTCKISRFFHCFSLGNTFQHTSTGRLWVAGIVGPFRRTPAFPWPFEPAAAWDSRTAGRPGFRSPKRIFLRISENGSCMNLGIYSSWLNLSIFIIAYNYQLQHVSRSIRSSTAQSAVLLKHSLWKCQSEISSKSTLLSTFSTSALHIGQKQHSQFFASADKLSIALPTASDQPG